MALVVLLSNCIGQDETAPVPSLVSSTKERSGSSGDDTRRWPQFIIILVPCCAGFVVSDEEEAKDW